jgi:hypothetical protein
MVTPVVRQAPGGGGAEPPVVATAGVVTPPPWPVVTTTPPDPPAAACVITTWLPAGTATSCGPADTAGLGTAWITAHGNAKATAPDTHAMSFTVRLLSFRFFAAG